MRDLIGIGADQDLSGWEDEVMAIELGQARNLDFIDKDRWAHLTDLIMEWWIECIQHASLLQTTTATKLFDSSSNGKLLLQRALWIPAVNAGAKSPQQ